MERAPFIALGRVIKAHGLKGEVSVAPVTGPPFFLPVGLRVWLVPPPESFTHSAILGVRPGPKGPLVSFEGIDTPELAHEIAGCEVLARAEDVPDDLADELFDPVGLAVEDVEHGDLGTIVEVIVTGANDVWVIEGAFGELLVPVIDDVVIDIDEDGQRATVRLLPGILPEE